MGGQNIADILAQATPRERTLRVCMRGDLAGQAETLAEDLAKTSEDWQPADLTEVHPARKVAEQLAKVREQMREAEVPFTLRYIGDRAYSDLLAAHPGDNGNELFNAEFPKALIAAACIDPVMTVEQAGELFEKLNQGGIKRLFDAAWDVHNSAEVVPFSLAASALLAGLGGES